MDKEESESDGELAVAQEALAPWVKEAFKVREEHPLACVIAPCVCLHPEAKAEEVVTNFLDFGQRLEFKDKGGGVIFWVVLSTGARVRVHLLRCDQPGEGK